MSTPRFAEPVAAPLEEVRERLRGIGREIGCTRAAQAISYPLQGEGKLLRPTIVLLANGASGGEPKRAVAFAAAVEVLHTATLVHDDVIDSSPLRRGRPTPNAIWGARASLFGGGYLFGRAAALAAETGNPELIRLLCETVEDICRGEIRQTLVDCQGPPTPEGYLRRIGWKTASLFATSAVGGAMVAGAGDEALQAMREYGFNLGMAFQIVDDILDFLGDEERLGKPTGDDLRHGTVTLPVLYFLEENPKGIPERVLRGKGTREEVEEAVALIRASSALHRSYIAAAQFVEKAVGALSAFPSTPYEEALKELAAYVLERER